MTAPSASQPVSTAAPAPRKCRGPKILMIIGAVIAVLAFVAGAVVGVLGLVRASSTAQDMVTVSGTGSYTAEADELVVIYRPEGAEVPTCQVLPPDGGTAGEGNSVNYSITYNGSTWESFDSFTAKTAGEYQFDCSGDTIAVGPPVSVGGILAGVGGILSAVFGGGFGLLLFLIGLIWFFVGRKKS